MVKKALLDESDQGEGGWGCGGGAGSDHSVRGACSGSGFLALPRSTIVGAVRELSRCVWVCVWKERARGVWIGSVVGVLVFAREDDDDGAGDREGGPDLQEW